MEIDVEAKAFVLQPKPKVVFSPKALWHTVELAGEKVVKLEGPSGVFTKKPKF